MKGKILGILCLVLFLATAGLGLGQEAQTAQQKQKLFIIQLFGVEWVPYAGLPIAYFSDLEVGLFRFHVRDVNGKEGTADIFVLVRKDLSGYMVLGGWLHHWYKKEQGFFRKLFTTGLKEDWFMTKVKSKGAWLEQSWIKNQDGKSVYPPVLIFSLRKKDGTEKEMIRLDIRQFIEKHFKDKDNPEK